MSALRTARVSRESLRLRLVGPASLFPLTVLFVINLMDEFDRAAFGVLLPTIRDDLGSSTQGVLDIAAAAGVLAFLAALVVGYWADRRSRKRLALGGAVIWIVFTLLTGMLPGIVLLAVARAGTAVGKAVVEPTHNSLLADYYEPRFRPVVYGIHRFAQPLGVAVGAVTAGVLSHFFGWRIPFLVAWVPTSIVVVLAATRMREPVRGEHERRLMGADELTAVTEDDAPSMSDAWRICQQVRTLRRIWYSLPFFGVSVMGIAVMYSIVYADVFHVGDARRGLIAALTEGCGMLGIAVGIPIAHRLARRSEGLVLRFLSGVGIVTALAISGFALAPSLPVAIAMNAVASAVLALIIPGLMSVLSKVLPARVRSMGFSIGGLYFLPGLVLLAVVGAVADAKGPRIAVLLLVPVFVVGSLLMASAAKFVDADLARVRRATLTQAELIRSRDEGDARLLLCRGLDVHYGSTQVLFGVDFEVKDGEIVALLGTNGAGKSTLLNAITGLVQPSAGAIVFDGRDITQTPANEAAQRGAVLMPGGKGVFPTLTVRENFDLACWMVERNGRDASASVEEVLGYFPVLRQRWNEKAGNLSGGEQQMLTLGQAFIARPRLLMIDELSLGLAPAVVSQLLDIVRAMHRAGTTLVLVEQSVNVAMSLAERAVFMEKGEVRFDGPTRDLLDHPEILRSVFLSGTASRGLTTSRSRPTAPIPVQPDGPQTPALAVAGLSVSFGGIKAVNDVSFDINQGEILGVIGPNGAGKTTIMDAISGFVTPTSGSVRLGVLELSEMSVSRRARQGLGRSFQDAKLFPALTVAEALAVALERHIEVRDPLAAALGSSAVRRSERAVTARVHELIDLMGLEAYANKFVAELSTGTRHIVDIACAVAHRPSVLLLDEPSSGIAQRETEAMGPVLLRIREQIGAAILLIEHDMPLIQSVSDRLLALEVGSVVTCGPVASVIKDPRVVESYLGTSYGAHSPAAPRMRSRTGKAT